MSLPVAVTAAFGVIAGIILTIAALVYIVVAPGDSALIIFAKLPAGAALLVIMVGLFSSGD